MRQQQIQTFYRHEQVLRDRMGESFSKSPMKPALVMDTISRSTFQDAVFVNDNFPAFERGEFYRAHTKKYVDDFFAGRAPLCTSNGLPWSTALTESVRYTNASLYHALRASIVQPECISFSPTSGFHHASPSHGEGFCTFSGQVIASVKLYEEFGVSGAWLDLDAHFGNSIEDSRWFVPMLNKAVPHGCNINPKGVHREYIEDFKISLIQLSAKILSGKIHYVVFCHGADSHIDDDTGAGQCTTAEWIECSTLFYRWVKVMDQKLKRPLPVTLSLFGGYRALDYQAVIDLHVADLACCIQMLRGASTEGILWKS